MNKCFSEFIETYKTVINFTNIKEYFLTEEQDIPYMVEMFKMSQEITDINENSYFTCINRNYFIVNKSQKES